MKKYFSKNGYLAVSPPEFKKVEQKIVSGFAMISQRTDVIEVDLIMDYQLDGNTLLAGHDRVILKGDAGLRQWAKEKLYIDGKEFVLCPESEVLGFTYEFDTTKSYGTKGPM